MDKYPATPLAAYSFIIEPEFRTAIAGFDGANEQRFTKWVFPKYNATLNYTNLSSADFQLLWDFYMSQHGAAGAFYFVSPDLATYAEKLYVATGDGTSTLFDLPGVSTSSASIYLGATLQSGGYTILSGGGGANADRVQFTSAPAQGSLIACAFTGYLRVRCRFNDDKLSKELFKVMLYKTGIALKGLGPEAS
jgi:hypothetical protein